MATNFPTSLDAFTNPTSTDTLDSPPHDTQHADANDAIEALQAKVGVDGSAVTSSLDYKLNAIGTWTTYTPTITASGTNPSNISTQDGAYVKLNKLVIVRFYVEFDGAAGGSGTWYVGMPLDIDLGSQRAVAFGTIMNGTTRYPVTASKSTSGPRNLFISATDGSLVTATNPFTFSTGDAVSLTVIYETDE